MHNWHMYLGCGLGWYAVSDIPRRASGARLCDQDELTVRVSYG